MTYTRCQLGDCRRQQESFPFVRSPRPNTITSSSSLTFGPGVTMTTEEFNQQRQLENHWANPPLY